MKLPLKALALSLSLMGAVQAHPLDFLTPEQRVYMMNQFMQAQDELANNPKKNNASGATPLTAEQRMKLLNWFMTGNAGGTSTVAAPTVAPLVPQVSAMTPVPTPTPPAVAAPAAATEAQLAAALAKWKPLTTGVKFERFRDGFAINGQRYIDPEGTIVSYGFDEQSGDFTYLAQSQAGQFVLKTGRAGTADEPLQIGTAERRGGLWSVVSVTGQKFAGARLIPLARGFIVARDNTGFRYVPGQGRKAIAAPEAFSIAALQSGNISGTGFILLERTPTDAGANNSLTGLIGAVKALGSTLGISKKEDYALLNIDTNKLVPVNVSMEDKQVQVMSYCRKRNVVVAECDRMDSYESLFQPNGLRNMTHYFWRINWFNAAGRPVMVSQEGGLTKVTVTDLNTGKKVALFERTMGIASFEANQGRDGRIGVTAQMGFSRESKDDAVALLDTLPDISESAEGSK